jgi:threonine synthase
MFLRCSSGQCDTVLDLHGGALACPRCGDLLEIVCEPEPFEPQALKQSWRQRRCSDDPQDRSGVWRFREFLPHYPSADSVVSMEEGNTPLVRGIKSATWAGVSNLRFKHLGWNPTGCFKDLGMTVGVTEAKYVGARIVGCASTGNTAGSMAAYAARAGITARVYLPAGAVSLAKLSQSLDYGAEIVEIDGNFDHALDTLLKGAEPDLYFLNSINPFRVEGQKTVIFEIMEQCLWEPPDYIVLPGGNLGNSAAFGKALEELKAFGLIEKVPRMVVVQAEGANPFARAWKAGAATVEPMAKPETEATAIRIGAPRSWKKALRAIRFSAGTVLDVSDAEIAEAKSVIGRDGIGCEPASATTLAGIRKLVQQGWMDADATIVAVLTGHVLKDSDYIIRAWRASRHENLAIDCCVH